ncbi:MAG: DEAD/DEAH box helicase, partial [Solobacterium sp.]|nr:DEAD/DEAH box helicase [Solobacterium sp.]
GKGKHFPVILILVPTRELAVQSAEVCRGILAKTEGIRTALLVGGTDMNAQVRAFSKGADIVIATPARLRDHLRRHTFKTKMLKALVIDEADMMLSMGFEQDIHALNAEIGAVQKILLSATFEENTRKLCMDLLHEPVYIGIEHEEVHRQNIRCHAAIVPADRKLDTLASLIRQSASPVLVFCNKRVTADFVSEQLNGRNIRSCCLHSEMDYAKRREIMARFKAGRIRALCATDVLSRGIDIGFLDCVILYDYPEDPSSLIHRTARSSRRSQPSSVYFLLTRKEIYRVKEAETVLNMKIEMI